MVHFRKRFSEEDLKRICELIAERGKAMVIEAVSSLPDDDDSDAPGADAGTQISLDDFVKPADWPEGKNWGTLTVRIQGAGQLVADLDVTETLTGP